MIQFAQDTVKTAQQHPWKIAGAAYFLGALQCASINGEHCFTGDNPAIQTAVLFMTGAAMITASKSTIAGRAYNRVEHAATTATEIATSTVKRVAGMFRKKPAAIKAEAADSTDKSTLKKGQ